MKNCLKRIKTPEEYNKVQVSDRDIAMKNCLKRIKESSLKIWQIISDALGRLY